MSHWGCQSGNQTAQPEISLKPGTIQAEFMDQIMIPSCILDFCVPSFNICVKFMLQNSDTKKLLFWFMSDCLWESCVATNIPVTYNGMWCSRPYLWPWQRCTEECFEHFPTVSGSPGSLQSHTVSELAGPELWTEFDCQWEASEWWWKWLDQWE